MKNKLDLILAAQKFALDNLKETDANKLGKLRHEAFDALAVSGEHYDEFRQQCENNRSAYANAQLSELKSA